jgi:hypothetical protein
MSSATGRSYVGECRYVTRSKRIDHREDTKLAVDAEEQRAILERVESGATASTPSYHFICECFFLTARSLHLGLIKMIQDLYNIARVRCSPSLLDYTGQTVRLLCWSPCLMRILWVHATMTIRDE